MAKVLVATEKPFAAPAVAGIKEIIEGAGFELALLEKYTEKSQLLEAVAPPGVPKFPLPGLHRRFTGLPSHFSATPRSPRRGWERQKGGGGETTSPPLRGESPGTLLVRIPPAPAAEAGVSRRCRRAEGRLQPGGRPARTPTTRLMQLRARNPARPRSLERARVARSHGQDPSPPSGETETL